MNNASRSYNSTLIIITGVVTLLGGGALLLAGLSATFAQNWLDYGDRARSWLMDAMADAKLSEGLSAYLPGTIVLSVIGLMLVLKAFGSQGGGKTSDIVVLHDGAGAKGTTVIELGLVKQALKAALKQHDHIQKVQVSAWNQGGKPLRNVTTPQGFALKQCSALKLDVVMVTGAAPQRVAQHVEDCVVNLRSQLGADLPVLLHLSGTKSASAQAPRVE